MSGADTSGANLGAAFTAVLRIKVTVADLLGPERRAHVAQHWPRLVAVLRKQSAAPIRDADGGMRFPVALRRLPGEMDPALDDLVVLDVADAADADPAKVRGALLRGISAALAGSEREADA